MNYPGIIPETPISLNSLGKGDRGISHFPIPGGKPSPVTDIPEESVVFPVAQGSGPRVHNLKNPRSTL